jgi:hypothetical protein
MAYLQSTNVKHASRSAVAWTSARDDARSHYRDVLMAIVPALAIITAAALFLVR